MEVDLYMDQQLYDNNIDELDVEIVIRKQYTVRPRPDLFNEYDNAEFFRRFRFCKQFVLMILTFIEEC